MFTSMQIKWPSKFILIGKKDLDAAYSRIHVNTWIVSTFVSIVDNLAHICICLPFRTTSAPAEYTIVIKSAIGLVEDLRRDKLGDATELQESHRQLLEEY